MKTTDITLGLRIEHDFDYSVEYEFMIRIYVGGEHKVRQEKARVEVDGAHLFDIEIKNGRLIKPRIRRPNTMALERFDSFMKQSETNRQRDTNLALPFENILSLTALFGNISVLQKYSKVSEALTETENLLRDMRFYHISPDALREPQKIASKYPLEEHGENLASVLEDMKRKPNQFMPELLNAFSQVVPGVSDLSVTRAGGHLVVKLLHCGGKNSTADNIWLDASQESDGTLRTLGLLVALYQDPTPPFIVIEEPELTIHPGALSVLAELIQEATQRTSLMVTTHSPELLDLLHIDCVRSVEAIDGATHVDMVADHQRGAVMTGLFTPGELHRMEGLQLAKKED